MSKPESSQSSVPPSPATEAKSPKGTKKEPEVFLCSLCDKNLSTLYSLNRHVRLHSGEKPYACPNCVKTFSESGGYRRHLRVHSGVKISSSCSVCQKIFTRQSGLKKHMLIHTNQKPHSCMVCGKAFTQVSHLKAHGKIHERAAAVAPPPAPPALTSALAVTTPLQSL